MQRAGSADARVAWPLSRSQGPQAIPGAVRMMRAGTGSLPRSPITKLDHSRPEAALHILVLQRLCPQRTQSLKTTPLPGPLPRSPSPGCRGRMQGPPSAGFSPALRAQGGGRTPPERWLTSPACFLFPQQKPVYPSVLLHPLLSENSVYLIYN